MGDFADLATLAEWAASNGARFLLLNPLHAPVPGPVPEDSPYFPSSRSFLNPLYISVPDVPGARDLPCFAHLEKQAQALNDKRLIERSQVWAYKSRALEAAFEMFEQNGGDPTFDDYVAERGKVLDGYTSFCALAERFGLPWQHWPAKYRHPSLPAVARLVGEPATCKRKRYHAWLQWTCERQLQRAASGGVGLVVDLAVGVDGSGADAWLWQDTFALSMRVGAPPDSFNLSGQDWGLPPWVPWKLRAAGYEPYIEMLRGVLRPAMGLRVDHVMGLFRLYWVPLGQDPSRGTYVHFPWHDMLGLLRLEATRAGAFIVGEDLGTVQQEVREALAASGVLSYRLLWFEDRRPPEWPTNALGAVTTHDLPTVAGVWTGADLEAQRSVGLAVDEASLQALRRRLAEWTTAAEDQPVEEVIRATYALLAAAPCSLVAAVLEDAAAVVERPNMPGTAGAWPNWRLALPQPLEEIEASELAGAIAERLGSR
jgi:4-alpha-glucanotransferase